MTHKLAFSSLGCPDLGLDQIIRTAVVFGFQGVSLRTVAGTTNLPGLPDFQLDRLDDTAASFRNGGVELLCMSSGVRFTSPDANIREEQFKIACWFVDTAQALGSRYIRIFGGPIDPHMDHDSTLKQIVDGVRSVADYAAKRSVTVLLETHDTFSTGASMRELVERIDHPSVGVIWDVLHPLRHGESPAQTWLEIGPWVRNVHIKDSCRFSASGFDLVPCGDGYVPIPAIVALIDREGYDGYLEFEWEKGWHPDIADAWVAFPHFIEYAAQNFGMKGKRG